MASRKKEQGCARTIVLPLPRKAFSDRSMRDRLKADLAFELDGRRIVEEADRLHRESVSLLRNMEETLRHLKGLEGKGKKPV
jgi:hypothetical protein